MKILPLYEEIEAEEAYTDEGALKSIIKGKRDIGFIDIKRSYRKILERHNIKIIPIRMTSIDNLKSVIFRNTPEGEEKANRLCAIAKSKNGYLRDDNPEEAREIGTLLGYSEKSINDYIWKKYISKLPIEPKVTDFPDD